MCGGLSEYGPRFSPILENRKLVRRANTRRPAEKIFCGRDLRCQRITIGEPPFLRLGPKTGLAVDGEKYHKKESINSQFHPPP